MKTILTALILISCICLASCDGRNRVHKPNKTVLKETKLLDSFSESIKYIPETYTEIKTDTLLSNGFHIKMKTYSSMNKSVLNEFKQDSINYKTYYREFVSEVIITINEEEIFNEIIDKSFLINLNSNLQLNHAIVKIGVDESSSTSKNSITLTTIIEGIENPKLTYLNLIVNAKGEYNLVEEPALYAYSN